MIFIVLAFFGLALGSFVNALVFRLHEQGKKGKGKKETNLSIVHGRSMCPHCKHTLAWYYLLPVVSWVLLSGKCRYCHKPISWQYPLVELLTPALFVISYLFWPSTIYHLPSTISFAFWLIFVTAFIALAVYDLRWMLLPNRIIYPLLWLAGMYQVILTVEEGAPPRLFAVALSTLVGGGIFYLAFQISDGKWIGGGDVKLGFLIGLILGRPELSLLALFLASVLGCLLAVPLLLTGRAKRTSRLPFGPFLMTGAVIAMLFGSNLIQWYMNLLASSTF